VLLSARGHSFRHDLGAMLAVREMFHAAGPADQYRQTPLSVVLLAASAHPKDLLATLTNNFTLASGQQFEILSAQQFVGGTEGSGILQ
jgi:hypothetical protein